MDLKIHPNFLSMNTFSNVININERNLKFSTLEGIGYHLDLLSCGRKLQNRLTPSFLLMVKLGPLDLLVCSLRAAIMAWRFFSASSNRLRFSSMSLCFFSSTSRCLRSSSCFFLSAMRFSSSARITLRLACFSFSFFKSSSSFVLCLRHSRMYSLSCSSKAEDFASCLCS